MTAKWNALAQPMWACWFVDDELKDCEYALVIAWLPIYRQGSETPDGIGWLDEFGKIHEFQEDHHVMWEALK